MTKNPKYSFAYAAASIRLNEMISIAEIANRTQSYDYKAIVSDNNVLGSITKTFAVRLSRELKNRLQYLTPTQIKVLATGDFNSQKHMAFLAVCKCYQFISDFVLEVMREKVLVYDYQLFESDYISFFNSKANIHPEIEGYTESTKNKAKQVMFLMLEQVGLINNTKDKNIQHQILNPDVIRAIADDNPDYLKLFLMPDADINTYK
ncbi:MAG: hypothetical protein B7C24_18130 [Bacteroidetes bacterium 4572_77]|nr:MAG: hypothetical protein B7C24_18130 [Bacteroidetes bacterium 4572_77]